MLKTQICVNRHQCVKFKYTFYPIQESELNKMQFHVSAATVQNVETCETSVALESV